MVFKNITNAFIECVESSQTTVNSATSSVPQDDVTVETLIDDSTAQIDFKLSKPLNDNEVGIIIPVTQGTMEIVIGTSNDVVRMVYTSQNGDIKWRGTTKSGTTFSLDSTKQATIKR